MIEKKENPEIKSEIGNSFLHLDFSMIIIIKGYAKINSKSESDNNDIVIFHFEICLSACLLFSLTNKQVNNNSNKNVTILHTDSDRNELFIIKKQKNKKTKNIHMEYDDVIWMLVWEMNEWMNFIVFFGCFVLFCFVWLFVMGKTTTENSFISGKKMMQKKFFKIQI